MKFTTDTSNIRMEMFRRGMSAKELSRLCKCPLKEVLSIFTAHPNILILIEVCKVLNVELDIEFLC